jgi:hypothetical protein
MAQSEADLLRLLHSTEHSFVERKTIGDSRDWVKTVVAFANTLTPDQEGILFIGAKDNGEIEDRDNNLDTVQKTFSEKLRAAYPPIYYTTRIVQEKGRECLAVIIPGSVEKPHFAGPAFLRDGSQSVEATPLQYESLIASRLGKVYELQKWLGKSITLRESRREAGVAYVVNVTNQIAAVVVVNQFYVTLDFGNRRHSYPLSKVEISYDNVADRLEIWAEGLPTPY